MTTGYKYTAAGAGIFLVLGFFLPWLGKTPFSVSGFSLAVSGYSFVWVMPVAGAMAALAAMGLSRPRPGHLIYASMAGLMGLVMLGSSLAFADQGVLALEWPAQAFEIIRLKTETKEIFFHPLKDLGAGLILSFAGIIALGLIPGFSGKISKTRNPGSYKQMIREMTLSAQYRRAGVVLACLVLLAVTWSWCGISPSKLWENRGNAREYLFGRTLSQADQDFIESQAERAPLIEAEGLAREYMSDKYRGVPFSEQPDLTAKTKEREAVKADFLARMDSGEKEKLKNEARKNALTEKRGGYFPPETSPPKIKGYIVALVETVAIAIWGTLLAVLCAVPVSFFAAKNTLELIISSDDLKSRSMRQSISFGVRRFLDACRGFNEFVMALIFVAVIGLGPYAGILALWIHTFGILGKVFSEQIEAIESGQVEALTSTGAGPVQTIAFSVMPQVLPVFVSYVLLRFESNVRSAAILGFVGAGGIGFLIFDKLNGYLFREVCTMMIIIIITVGIIDHFCGKIRMRFI